MLESIIAAIVAALVVLVVIVAIAVVRSRRGNETPMVGPRVSHVDTLAFARDAKDGDGGKVSSTPMEAPGQAVGNLKTRFVALGVLVAGIFGSLTAKLWSLQVLSSSVYEERAENNLFVTVSTPAPRGEILDSTGQVLAKNRSAQTVLAEAEVATDTDVLRRLSAVLGIPFNILRQRAADSSAGAQGQRVLAEDARLRDVAFISEHADAFEGITIEMRTIREYPYGALAAHALGYTGSPTQEQLDGSEEGREILSVDTVGLAGLESKYDNVISGDHGARRVAVDAVGNVVEVVSETLPTKGSDIVLTLDSRVQYVADTALAELIAPGDVIGMGKGVSGAAVVLDVRTGAVVAMSSFPTYDPNKLTGSISEDIWSVYNSEDSYAPLSNRVVNGLYAAASTYKAFTSLAALQYGFADGTSTWDCTGSWDGFGSGDIQKCWNHAGHGVLDLRGGIVNSCDVVFYEIAKAFYDHGPNGTGELSETALQDYLKRFGLGQVTGIDLDNESAGRIPTPEWKTQAFRNRPADGVWRGGDYTNMIIGQGDVLVTPLQIAVAYGGIATGTIMKPHLLQSVRNSQGETVVTYEPEVVMDLDVDPSDLAFVRDALRGVITDNKNPARLFEEAGVQAAGKSGTAEHTEKPDDAWFVAYAPYDDPKYVAAVVIEQGGGGSEVAAPLVAQLLQATLAADSGTSDVVPQRLVGSTGQVVEYKGTSGERED